LHLGKEYQCKSGSLIFSATKSLYGGYGGTTLGILTLTGGILNHSRTFLRDSEGGLVMTVREKSIGYAIIWGAANSATSYVRWLPVKHKVPGKDKAP
jgi:hypothetical protein